MTAFSEASPDHTDMLDRALAEPEMKAMCFPDDGSDEGPWFRRPVTRTRDDKRGWDETFHPADADLLAMTRRAGA